MHFIYLTKVLKDQYRSRYLASWREYMAIQACYRMSDAATLEREVKALVALHSVFPLSKAMIITYEDEDTIERDGLEIEVRPIWKWILE